VIPENASNRTIFWTVVGQYDGTGGTDWPDAIPADNWGEVANHNDIPSDGYW
jgi:hypothetical protein